MTAEPVILYTTHRDGHVCRLDWEDYQWAIQWRWGAVPNRQGTAYYVSRPTRVKGKPVRIYLHKEVLKRSGLKPRTRHHKIGDHKDGDTLNNTRDNLRWATGSMNSRNTKARRARRAGI